MQAGLRDMFRMNPNQKIHVVTMGCSKNLVDSESLMGQMKLNSVRLTKDMDEADMIIINTCGFIEAAKQESIDAILEAVERKKQGLTSSVIVMGCLSERFRDDLRKEIPEVDVYFGSHEMENILGHLGIDYRKELVGERLLTTPSHFAYLKISEGCDNPCSFCAIPLMRGGHVSKSPGQIVDEVAGLARKGVRELVLIGQDTTAYGTDRTGTRELAPLLEQISDVEEIRWIRLMYAYPAKFPLDVLRVIRERENMCNYIDMPVQHIADRMLRSMRRGITSRATKELIERMHREVPGLALRTTLIVGYPGETGEDFRQLVDFVAETRFHRLGVFPYSQEDGTTAYELGDPVPEEVKKERMDEIMAVQQEISEERNRTMVGSTVEVVVDRNEQGTSIGRTAWDAPEIDQEVIISSTTPLQRGNFYHATITDASEFDLMADVVRDPREVPV